MDKKEANQEIINTAKKEPQQNKDKPLSSFTPINENKHIDSRTNPNINSRQNSAFKNLKSEKGGSLEIIKKQIEYLDEKFKMDYVALIKKFLENIKDDGVYQFCIELKKKFTSAEIFKLKTMLDEEQVEYLKKFLTEEEFKIFKLYRKIEKKPTIDGFLDYIDELIDLNNPCILVYVGKKEENYDHLSKYIKTVYSKEIYKGIKIIYKKRIYDYSLNERNV